VSTVGLKRSRVGRVVMTEDARAGGSQTLERGLAVLVEIGRHPGGRTTTELVKDCQLHRSILRRLLVSLERTGFTRRDDAGRYHVGPALARFPTPPTPALIEVAEPVLARLAEDLDATVTLVEVRGDAAVTTLVLEPPTDGPRVSFRVGSTDPLDRGAGGLAALASQAHRTGEPERVSRARDAGHLATFGELNPGVHGVAAPLPGWEVPAAVNVVTSRPDVAERAVAPLLHAAAEISSAVRDEPGAR
jgi:DNA-binding IclR family transcriptional regulator